MSFRPACGVKSSALDPEFAAGALNLARMVSSKAVRLRCVLLWEVPVPVFGVKASRSVVEIRLSDVAVPQKVEPRFPWPLTIGHGRPLLHEQPPGLHQIGGQSAGLGH